MIDDVTRRTPIGFAAAGDAVYLLGETHDELAGSAWADAIHDHLGGRPPTVDFDHEKRLAEVMIRASRRGVLSSAHDLADGGLAQALVESCLRHGFGVEVGAAGRRRSVRDAVLREHRPGAGLDHPVRR